MFIEILSPEEAAYRNSWLIYFDVFGVIDSDVALDFESQKVVKIRSATFPPLHQNFLTVSLTRQGDRRRKDWLKRSNQDMSSLKELVDPYLQKKNMLPGRYLMSKARVREEFKAGRTEQLLRMYDFDIE